jgi:replicative DNA helicase
MNNPSWKDAPPEVKYLAQDRNGGTGKVQMFFQKECTRFLEKGTGI